MTETSVQGEIEPISLLLEDTLEEFDPLPCRPCTGVVSWSPPQVNWNPWLNCNIDEGPLASVFRLK